MIAETTPESLSVSIPEFDTLVNQIQRSGTDNMSHFQNGYEFQGGLRLQQNPYEFAALVSHLRNRGRIRRYFEIGSASGGSGRFIYENVGCDEFVSMDDYKHHDAAYQSDNFKNIINFKNFIGDSHSEEAKEFLNTIYPDNDIDVAFIDGDHSYEGVRQDLEMTYPHCRKGAWILFHDTVACFGVKSVWEQSINTGHLKPIANFVGRLVPLGIGIGEVV